MGSAARQLEMLLTCDVKSEYFEVSQNQKSLGRARG